jgi:hypothetical protein
MKDSINNSIAAIALLVIGCVFGAVVEQFILGKRFMSELQPLIEQKNECEKNLPRNERCVIQFVPVEVVK